ncbi:MAG: CRTAC1 family protein [Gemmataceae bacterium]
MARKGLSRSRLWAYLAGVAAGGLAVAIILTGRRPGDGSDDWPPVTFQDVTRTSGIRFVHFSGATPRKLLPETMGSGVAVIDFDGDGRQDLLFVNSCPWPGQSGPPSPPTLALYRNLGGGRFSDVTREAGLDVTVFGMGATVGDYDNDGWPDVFVTAVGGNRLFRNEGGRRLRDVTAGANVGGPGGWPDGFRGDFFAWPRPLGWSTSAAWLDYDGDGWLDLFVCNYVTWSPAHDADQGFRLAGGERAYGPPRAFAGTRCLLYRNRRDGTFEDVSRKAGVEVTQRGEAVGKSLGVVVRDVDEDGWPDVFVANDTERNFFFHNVADGSGGERRFREVGEATGVAFADRHARGAMGIDWGAGAAGGKNALLVGNFADEPNTFLVQQRARDLVLTDLAPSEGVAGPSRPFLKFGLFFFDYDLDGRLDFLTSNGHLEPDIARAHPDQKYAQPVQLFWNGGPRAPRFGLVPASAAGRDLIQPLVGRGCAHLDFDGDGALDVVLTANGGAARLLRNVNRTGHHWLRLRLEGDGKRSNRSAIGARIVIETGGQEQRREVTSARGYLSQSEPVVTFGLGREAKVDRVTIHWPGREAGPPTVLTHLEADREHHVVQGK